MSCPETKLKTTSGAPWSTRAAVVRNAHGTIVKDATKLSDGAEVTVVPAWADRTPLASRFTVVDTVATGPARLAENTGPVVPGTGAAHEAAWRAQGGTKDAYSVLPDRVVRALVAQMDDAALAEALAWSSINDFSVLRQFARTDEHANVVAVRSSASADAAGPPVQVLQHVPKVLEWSEASVAERERLREALRSEVKTLHELLDRIARRATPTEFSTYAMHVEAAASKLQQRAADAEQTLRSVASHRDAWTTAVISEVSHDAALVDAVTHAGSWAMEVAHVEMRGAGETADAVGYLKTRMRTAAESYTRGDTEGAKRVLHGTLTALQGAEQSLTRGIQASRELMEGFFPAGTRSSN